MADSPDVKEAQIAIGPSTRWMRGDDPPFNPDLVQAYILTMRWRDGATDARCVDVKVVMA